MGRCVRVRTLQRGKYAREAEDARKTSELSSCATDQQRTTQQQVFDDDPFSSTTIPPLSSPCLAVPPRTNKPKNQPAPSHQRERRVTARCVRCRLNRSMVSACTTESPARSPTARTVLVYRSTSRDSTPAPPTSSPQTYGTFVPQLSTTKPPDQPPSSIKSNPELRESIPRPHPPLSPGPAAAQQSKMN